MCVDQGTDKCAFRPSSCKVMFIICYNVLCPSDQAAAKLCLSIEVMLVKYMDCSLRRVVCSLRGQTRVKLCLSTV